ncbi:MAG: 3-oxoadipate enol-lactonase [Alphaproteobacteria bacterium]|nr:3-oxoadipate enol-lactonase [Alphaproteobacteria bacterium]
MRFESIGDLTHHVSLEGPAGAPVVAFANSLGTDFRIWDGVVDRLPPSVRILRYDMRGHGLTSAPQAPYAMTDLRDDLLGILDRLGLDQVALVGLSVGGMVAQSAAAKAPERFSKLVLCDTGHVIATREIWNARIETVETGGMTAIVDSVLDRWFGPDFKTRDPALHAGMHAMLTTIPPQGYNGICAAIRDADLTEDTARIAVPALCLCGTEDKATPTELVASLADLLPNGSYMAIPGAGHLPCIEQPDAVARHIIEFLGL